MKNQFFFYFLLACSFFFIKPTYSQTMEMSMVPDSTTTIELDFARIWSSNSGQSIVSGNYGLQYKQVLNQKFNLVGKVNLIHFNFDFSEANNSVSNVFLGFQYKPNRAENVNSALNVGVFIPTASLEAQNGAFFNLYDVPKYFYKSASIHVSYNSFHHFDSGLRIGYELGSDAVISIDDNFNDSEIFGRYGFSIMYLSTSGVYIQSELLGIANITNDGDGFDDSTFHTYAFGAGYKGNEIAIGVFYKNYFDDLFDDSFKGIVGLEFSSFL